MKIFKARKKISLAVLCLLTAQLLVLSPVLALENPKSGSVGIEAKIPGPAPKQGATIVSPANGQVFTQVPIQVSGSCPRGLLVKVFSNNVFVGSTQCTSGSYSIKADLFSGKNDLVARVFDNLNQSGPDSNTVSVTFNDAQFAQFGTHVSLSSNYAKRGADPGQELTWPIIVSGGIGPYAISVDWGDSKAADLISRSSQGTFTIKHVYDSAGAYNIVVKATDAKGTSAFLQLVGIGNGQANQAAGNTTKTKVQTKTVVLWWPALLMLPLILITFWIGKRYELFSIRKSLEENRNS